MAETTVVDAFWITGRGLVLALDLPVEHFPGTRVAIEYLRPDGASLLVEGVLEIICRRSATPIETTGVFLPNVARDEIAKGAVVNVRAPQTLPARANGHE